MFWNSARRPSCPCRFFLSLCFSQPITRSESIVTEIDARKLMGFLHAPVCKSMPLIAAMGPMGVLRRCPLDSEQSKGLPACSKASSGKDRQWIETPGSGTTHCGDSVRTCRSIGNRQAAGTGSSPDSRLVVGRPGCLVVEDPLDLGEGRQRVRRCDKQRSDLALRGTLADPAQRINHGVPHSVGPYAVA